MDKNFWDGLLNLYLEDQKVHPKAMNVLSYAIMNENQHTLFLCGLLNYEYCGVRPFLKSFIEMATDTVHFVDIGKVRVTTQDHYVDCLITDGNLSIIVENKVCGAGDQNNQIESYISRQMECGIAFDKIYVVYLTNSGGSPASHSLSEEMINKLGDRYKERNYNDILQWLQKDVLFSCHYPEKLLTASVEIYIDRIRRILGQEDKLTIATAARKYLKDNFIVDYSEIQKLRDNCPEGEQIEVFQEILNAVLETMLAENIYLDQYRTAYELKWIIKNNPGAFGKNWTGGDFAPFNNSIGNFTYHQTRFVQLWAYFNGKGCRIHLPCTVEGIKRGPYLFASDIPGHEAIWNIDQLVKNGFYIDDGIYRFPYPDFTTDKPLTDVARHIEKMIHLLNDSQKNNA